jgi:SAM-dependent methyltransferase
MTRICRPGPERGYDLWAESYDTTPNPIVAMDQRVTLDLLQPQAGEHILDAGCGTGRNLGPILDAGASAAGFDFSEGMLAVAARRFPNVPLQRGDLHDRPWPFPDHEFDAVLCALVGEHLRDLDPVFGEMWRVLKPGGRLVFSTYHPCLAEAGKEANFQLAGVEYRLGAVAHTVGDFREAVERAGFQRISVEEFSGDEDLARAISAAAQFVGKPVLVVFTAKRHCDKTDLPL